MSRPPVPPRPRAARGPPIGVRRFGRNDFERFDEATRGSHICVGSASIGKVDIDCKYHWKKAQWGVLGSDRNPAGIVYMDITFKQPHGYWLERASVFITLSEDMNSYALVAPHKWKKPRKTRVGAGSSTSRDYNVQLTGHYGPRHLTGRPTTASTSRATKFTPSIDAAGFGVGGVGFESSTSREKAARWVFRGHVGRPKDGFGLRTLQWELSENALDPAQAHSQEYRTGFAFEHSERPVFMRVEVEGKLRSLGRQLKHEWLTFSSWSRRRDNSTLTHMDFNSSMNFDKSLDALASGLDKAMEEENMERGPVEVPDPMPALFSPDGASQAPGRLPSTMASPAGLPSSAGHRVDSSMQPAIDGATRPVECLEEPGMRRLNGRLRSRANGNLNARVRLQEADECSAVEAPADEDQDVASNAIDSESSGSEKASDEAVNDLLKIPAVLFILKFVVMIARFFSNLPPPPRHPSEDQNEVWVESMEGQAGYSLNPRMLESSLPFQLRRRAGVRAVPALSRTLLPSPELEGRQGEPIFRRNTPARIRSW